MRGETWRVAGRSQGRGKALCAQPELPEGECADLVRSLLLGPQQRWGVLVAHAQRALRYVQPRTRQPPHIVWVAGTLEDPAGTCDTCQPGSLSTSSSEPLAAAHATLQTACELQACPMRPCSSLESHWETGDLWATTTILCSKSS